jgi:hypothetical protein
MAMAKAGTGSGAGSAAGVVILTTFTGREVSKFGLDLAHKLATDTSGNLKRLDRNDAEPMKVVGVCEFLSGKLQEVPETEKGTVGIEITPSAAKTWLNALVLWKKFIGRIADRARKGYGRVDAVNAEHDADEIAQQLHEQLNLRPVSLADLARDEDDDGAASPVSADEGQEQLFDEGPLPVKAADVAGSISTAKCDHGVPINEHCEACTDAAHPVAPAPHRGARPRR